MNNRVADGQALPVSPMFRLCGNFGFGEWDQGSTYGKGLEQSFSQQLLVILQPLWAGSHP